MAVLAEDERMLKNMLKEVNDRCEDYGMKKRRRPWLSEESQRRYIYELKVNPLNMWTASNTWGFFISSNMNCSQEVKQRITMAKEAFNRKRNIFCGPLKKELWKRLVKCFVWSGVYCCMVQRPGHYDGMCKND